MMDQSANIKKKDQSGKCFMEKANDQWNALPAASKEKYIEQREEAMEQYKKGTAEFNQRASDALGTQARANAMNGASMMLRTAAESTRDFVSELAKIHGPSSKVVREAQVAVATVSEAARSFGRRTRCTLFPNIHACLDNILNAYNATVAAITNTDESHRARLCRLPRVQL